MFNQLTVARAVGVPRQVVDVEARAERKSFRYTAWFGQSSAAVIFGGYSHQATPGPTRLRQTVHFSACSDASDAAQSASDDSALAGDNMAVQQAVRISARIGKDRITTPEDG